MIPNSRELAARFFSEEEIDRSDRYHRPVRRVGWIASGVSLAWLALLTFSPLGSWVARPVDGVPLWAYATTYAAVVVASGALIGLPFSFWRGYVHEHRWGFSTRKPAGWVADWGKGFAVSCVLASVAMLALIEAASALPDAWVAVVAPGAAFVVWGLSYLGPVVFEPIFNRFRALDDPALVGALRELADRAGVPVRRVLVADASRRTRKENAYVSGLARTRRIVVFDTLLARASAAEVVRVVAHELGHWRDRHVVRGTLLGAAVAAGGVVALFFVLRSEAVLNAIDAHGAADPRIVPFVLLAAAAAGIVLQPLAAGLSRRWERAADRTALELTGDAAGLAEMHRDLAITNLSELAPSRLAYTFGFTHPTPAERIAAALDGGVTSAPAPRANP